MERERERDRDERERERERQTDTQSTHQIDLKSLQSRTDIALECLRGAPHLSASVSLADLCPPSHASPSLPLYSHTPRDPERGGKCRHRRGRPATCCSWPSA